MGGETSDSPNFIKNLVAIAIPLLVILLVAGAALQGQIIGDRALFAPGEEGGEVVVDR